MLILMAGLFGVVALPFVILMMPVLLWLALPTAVAFAVGYAVKLTNESDWLKPSSTHRRSGSSLS